jgi:hypothetical protein
MTTMYNSNVLSSSENERNKDKFSINNFKQVKPKLNGILNSLINTKNWSYGTEITPFVYALKNELMCHYQSRLIDAYLKSPEDNLKLDCDYLSITIKTTKKDVLRLIEDGGIREHRIKDMSLIFTINNGAVKNVNDGVIGSNRPYYNHAFNLTVSGGANVKLYLADGSGHANGIIGIKIDHIPDHLSDFEHRCIFGHIKSALTHERYNTLILKARITRVDVGFNMQGVCSAFVFATLRNNRTKDSCCFPLGDGRQIVETCYLGSKNNSSYTIIYDKTLKVMKDLKDSAIMGGSELISHHSRQCSTTRIEYKHYPYRSNGILLLSNLCDARVRLDDVWIIDPKMLHHCSDDLLANLLRDKTLQAIKHQRNYIKEASKGKCKARAFSLDSDWMEQQCSMILNHYRKLIIAPKTVKASEISEYLVKL